MCVPMPNVQVEVRELVGISFLFPSSPESQEELRLVSLVSRHLYLLNYLIYLTCGTPDCGPCL